MYSSQICTKTHNLFAFIFARNLLFGRHLRHLRLHPQSMALNAGNRRSCTKNVSYQSVYEKENDLRSFLFSDEEASDAEDEESDGEDCVTYDPAEPLPKFDKKKGQSEWVGRRIWRWVDPGDSVERQ